MIGGGGIGRAKGRVFGGDGHVVSTVHSDTDGSITYAQSQNVRPILEHNANLRSEGDGYNKDRDMRRYASIPVTILLGWLRSAGIDPRAYMRNPRAYSTWLNKKINENQRLKTAPNGTRYTPVRKSGFLGLGSAIAAGRKVG